MCYGTPGLTLFTTIPFAPIRGMISKGTQLFVVAGSFLYLVTPTGSAINLGQFGPVDGRTNPVGLAYNETQLILVDGQEGYIYPFSNIASVGPQTAQDLLNQMFKGLGTIARQQGF
jgi:hypothetical protein